ncbi:MAG: cyanophycinase [Ignavibacteriales bacterium]|nr:cyanophycinase [Ignavibacteriales bacterium]
MKIFKLFLSILLFSSFLYSQTRGKLFIIGGGTVPGYMIDKYVELAGGKNSKFLVVPMASGVPQQSASSFIKKLQTAGCTKVKYLISNKESADADSNLIKLKNVTGIYFTGGDQSKLIAALTGTKLLEGIKNIYKNGGVIGGSSAGAAVMSGMMLTGNELVNKDTVNAFNIIVKGNVQTVDGFGFINNAIVDQHFIKRKRINRLLTLVLENPKLVGIGIDESTAIVVNSDDTFEVIGESLVTVFDASKVKDISTDKNNNLSASDIRMHLLKSGDAYNIKSHAVTHKRDKQ